METPLYGAVEGELREPDREGMQEQDEEADKAHVTADGEVLRVPTHVGGDADDPQQPHYCFHLNQ